MPRASINVELEDGDLRKFVEDMARRWTLNTIHDLLKHLRDPQLVQLLKEAVRMGMAAESRVGRRGPSPEEDVVGFGFERGGPPPHQRPDGDGWVQGRSPFHTGMAEEILRGSPGVPGASQEGTLKRCVPVEANPYQEEGWLCHQCSFVNGVYRAACRHCKHERCDVVAPPPPSGDNVPSGSA